MNKELAEYGFNLQKAQENQQMHSLPSVEKRAEAEVQAAYIIAKKFPREIDKSMQRITEVCARPMLAEQATYEYPRGGKNVKGPSIRLAEVLAQAWGNIDCGVRELSRSPGISVAESYAIDLETNTRSTKTFQVAHVRDKGKQKVKLTEERDIYEMIANYGSRRMRAAILAIIPKDVTDYALMLCEKTMLDNIKDPEEQVAKLEAAFEEFGVTIDDITAKFGCNRKGITRRNIVDLKGIYRSLKDGMAAPWDFFKTIAPPEDKTAEKELDKMKELTNAKKGTEQSAKAKADISGENETAKVQGKEQQSKQPEVQPGAGNFEQREM